MPSKGQPKGDAKKKAKPTPFNSKNPLHIPELARLLKLAREKYQLKQSTELLNFVTCTGPVWGERNKTEPGITFQRKAPDGGLSTRILKTCKPEEKNPAKPTSWHKGVDAAGPGENMVDAVVFNDGSDEDASDDGTGAVVLGFRSNRGQAVCYRVLKPRGTVSFAPEAMREGLARRLFHDAHGDAREPTAAELARYAAAVTREDCEEEAFTRAHRETVVALALHPDHDGAEKRLPVGTEKERAFKEWVIAEMARRKAAGGYVPRGLVGEGG